jgi:hypothetical protein
MLLYINLGPVVNLGALSQTLNDTVWGARREHWMTSFLNRLHIMQCRLIGHLFRIQTQSKVSNTAYNRSTGDGRWLVVHTVEYM